MFDFVEIEDLKKKGYYMQPFGKEKQNLANISDYGGWDKVQEKHFTDGGIFDQIYER